MPAVLGPGNLPKVTKFHLRLASVAQFSCRSSYHFVDILRPHCTFSLSEPDSNAVQRMLQEHKLSSDTIRLDLNWRDVLDGCMWIVHMDSLACMVLRMSHSQQCILQQCCMMMQARTHASAGKAPNEKLLGPAWHNRVSFVARMMMMMMMTMNPFYFAS